MTGAGLPRIVFHLRTNSRLHRKCKTFYSFQPYAEVKTRESRPKTIFYLTSPYCVLFFPPLHSHRIPINEGRKRWDCNLCCVYTSANQNVSVNPLSVARAPRDQLFVVNGFPIVLRSIPIGDLLLSRDINIHSSVSESPGVLPSRVPYVRRRRRPCSTYRRASDADLIDV